jgi:hypothetical protein
MSLGSAPAHRSASHTLSEACRASSAKSSGRVPSGRNPGVPDRTRCVARPGSRPHRSRCDVARHRGVDELCSGGHVSENPLVDRREVEAQADPRDLAFISVQPLKIGPNSPFKVNRSRSAGPGSRWLELVRSGQPSGSRCSLDRALGCRFTDPLRHWPACIERGRLGPPEGGVAQKILVCIVLLA